MCYMTEDRGASYIGDIAVTADGIECVKWSHIDAKLALRNRLV